MSKGALWVPVSIGISLLLCTACGERGSSKSARQPTPLDLSTAGTVSGQVRFDGPVPEQTVLQLSGWSECAAQHPEGNPRAGDVLVNDGRLQNAVVYVKEGLGDRVFAVPTGEITIDQKGCVFVPRTATVRVEQPLRLLNSDPVAHNVHGLTKVARAWNFSLGVKGAARTVTVDKPEVMIELKCDIHPWMHAYVGAFDHPYFALSGADGQFALKDLPPGEYTVEAWHERFGTRSQKVSLGAKETKEIVFTFTAEDRQR
ncbi:MAG TPA: carboxypeptidase regulatory-like domain-containing protein [Candidatus Binatia bacterium]|nr:carboxypeptidase regulatory-like domain-containing protein [Candidatus Binatia bacterium]